MATSETKAVLEADIAADSTPSPQPLQLEDEQPSRAPRSKLRLAALLTALYLSMFIYALDINIMSTAIPTISHHFGTASGYVWIGAAYGLASAASSTIWAKCSDIWGRKPILLGAVFLFACGNLMAGLSVSMRMLIAARALQGTAGGGLLQMVLITISDLFSMRERVLYIAYTEVLWAFAGGIGPLIGGAFTQYATWRWCFWVNLPISGTAFLLLFFFLDVHNPRTSLADGIRALDWYGTISLLAVVVMILLGLDLGGVTFSWGSATIVCLLVFGTIMIGVFFFTQKKLATYPLMPLNVFKNSANFAALTVGISQGMCFIPADYYLPLYFQAVRLASPLRSGVLILPITISESVFGMGSGLITHWTGRTREVLWAGVLLVAVGTGLYITFGVSTPLAQLVGFMLIGGSGCGLLFEAPIIAIQNTVDQRDVATATATFSMTRNVATSASIVLGGVVIQNGMAGQGPALRAAGLSPQLVNAFTDGQASANVDLIGTIQDASQQLAVKTAFAHSFKKMWIMYTVIAAVGALAGPFFRHKRMSAEHTETRTGIDEMKRRGEA